MDVVEYFKAEQRICKFYMQGCRKCPLSSFNNGADMGCTLFVRREPEKCANTMKKMGGGAWRSYNRESKKSV